MIVKVIEELESNEWRRKSTHNSELYFHDYGKELES
jgi:hypothetical protein